MIKGGVGGGNTRTGLVFEGKVDLATFLSKQPRYKILNGIVYYDNEKVARYTENCKDVTFDSADEYYGKLMKIYGAQSNEL